MADLRRDFWIREIGTGQQMAQLRDRRMMMMMMMMMMTTNKNLQQLQKHQAKVTENECNHLVLQHM